jgi:hypothetical protein
MTQTNEGTLSDPRGSDRERALFLDCSGMMTIEAHVRHRAEAEIAKLRSALMAEVDHEKIRAVKFTVAEAECRKRQIESEGCLEGMLIGFSGSVLLGLLIRIRATSSLRLRVLMRERDVECARRTLPAALRLASAAQVVPSPSQRDLGDYVLDIGGRRVLQTTCEHKPKSR